MAQDGAAFPKRDGREHGAFGENHEYLTIGEFAQWLRISRGSAWAIVMERREIPHVRLSERVIRLARRDVEAYVASRRSDAWG